MKKLLAFSLALLLTGCTSQSVIQKPQPVVSKNTTGLPLQIPADFSISIFAKDLETPRVLAQDPQGTLITSIPSQGRVVALPSGQVVADNLNQPHGLAFVNNKLYVAETNQVSIIDGSKKRKIIDLPGGAGHFTRTLLVKDNQLFVSVGSSCNVCEEKDNRRAAILTADLDGNNVRRYATGLRNSVFMAENPHTKQIWATEMGRDLLGDDIPPDEINIIDEGKNYGWPYCYGKQVIDPFNKNQTDCQQTEPSFVDLQAHSAPLGLAFIPNSWPEGYRNDLLVSFHGSWNRSVPTGYKIVRIKLDESGKYEGTEDFITGWLTDKNEVLGRPVDLLFDDQGNLYISDDKAGVIYLLKPPGIQSSL